MFSSSYKNGTRDCTKDMYFIYNATDPNDKQVVVGQDIYHMAKTAAENERFRKLHFYKYVRPFIDALTTAYLQQQDSLAFYDCYNGKKVLKLHISYNSETPTIKVSPKHISKGCYIMMKAHIKELSELMVRMSKIREVLDDERVEKIEDDYNSSIYRNMLCDEDWLIYAIFMCRTSDEPVDVFM
jgi:hypothetical protein